MSRLATFAFTLTSPFIAAAIFPRCTRGPHRHGEGGSGIPPTPTLAGRGFTSRRRREACHEPRIEHWVSAEELARMNLGRVRVRGTPARNLAASFDCLVDP